MIMVGTNTTTIKEKLTIITTRAMIKANQQPKLVLLTWKTMTKQPLTISISSLITMISEKFVYDYKGEAIKIVWNKSFNGLLLCDKFSPNI